MRPCCVLPLLAAAAGTSAAQLNRVAAASKRTYVKQEIIQACGWGNRTIPSDANMLAGKRRGQRGAAGGREAGPRGDSAVQRGDNSAMRAAQMHLSAVLACHRRCC